MADDVTISLELLRRAQQGDHDALDRLLARYYDRILAIVRMRMGGRLRSHLESRDLLHEVFLTVVKSYRDFEVRDESKIIAWIAEMVERRVVDAARRINAEKRGAGGEVRMSDREESEPPDPVDSSNAVSELGRLEKREEISALEHSMLELDEDDREVIILHRFIGHPWAEIAAKLGLSSADAARMFFVRALEKLGRIQRRHAEGR